MSTTEIQTDPAAEIAAREAFIEQRLERTCFHLKTLDLAIGLMRLGLFLLCGLFVLVLWDHWVVGLNVTARFVSMAVLLVGAIALGIRFALWPLLQSINPDFAALTVEQAHPELKNGLISFLFFRERRDLLRKGVFHGLQHQAAADLAEVPIDSAVDRSSLIKYGYVLIAVAVIWVGYILASPKDSLQSVQRILFPWRDIVRPSQVEIAEVAPGSTDVYRGQSLAVSARIFGLQQDQTPAVVFSTLDGQLVDQRLVMTSEGAASRYGATLSMSEHGILQDVEYRIEAGDAISSRYQVTVTAAPIIEVERLELDYPAYTELAHETLRGKGDIQAVEGTRVTVFGKANQIIHRGQISFTPTAEDATTPIQAALRVDPADAHRASARFALRLNPQRDAGMYRSYHLHFVDEAGQSSVDPVEHTIEVIPDRRPVVQILRPTQRTIELPLNRSQLIEVRAVDPDFKLTRVQVAARTRGRNLFRESLLATERPSQWHQGQFHATYELQPQALGLRVGDVVEYLAVAEDNRQAINQQRLDPHRTITAKQFIRIVEPEPRGDNSDQEDATGQDATDPPTTQRQQPQQDPAQSGDPPQDPAAQQEQQPNDADQSQSGQDGQPSDDGQPPMMSDSPVTSDKKTVAASSRSRSRTVPTASLSKTVRRDCNVTAIKAVTRGSKPKGELPVNRSRPSRNRSRPGNRKATAIRILLPTPETKVAVRTRPATLRRTTALHQKTASPVATILARIPRRTELPRGGNHSTTSRCPRLENEMVKSSIAFAGTCKSRANWTSTNRRSSSKVAINRRESNRWGIRASKLVMRQRPEMLRIRLPRDRLGRNKVRVTPHHEVVRNRLTIHLRPSRVA